MLNSFAFLEQCTNQLLHHKAVQSTHAEGMDEKIASMQRSLRQMMFHAKEVSSEVRAKREEYVEIRMGREHSDAELQRVTLRMHAQLTLRAHIVKDAEALLESCRASGRANTDGVEGLVGLLKQLELEGETSAAVAKAEAMETSARLLHDIETRVATHVSAVSAVPGRLEIVTTKNRANTEANASLTVSIATLRTRLAAANDGTAAARAQKAMWESHNVTVQRHMFETEQRRTHALPSALEAAEAQVVAAREQIVWLTAEKVKGTSDVEAILKETQSVTSEAVANEASAAAITRAAPGSVICTKEFDETVKRTAAATAECEEMETAAATLRSLLRAGLTTALASQADLAAKEAQLRAQTATEHDRQQRRMRSRVEKRAARLRNSNDKQRHRLQDDEATRRDRFEYDAMKWMVSFCDALRQEHTSRQRIVSLEGEDFASLTRKDDAFRVKRVRNSPHSPAVSEMSLFNDRPMGTMRSNTQDVFSTPIVAAAAAPGRVQGTPAARRILFGNAGAAPAPQRRPATAPKGKAARNAVVDLFEDDF